MSDSLWDTFAELVRTPFQHLELVWGIIPLYFGLLLNELTSAKANFRTSIQTGFSFVWAGVQWLYPYITSRGGPHLKLNAMVPINLLVTFLVIAFGVIALVSGIRKRFPKHTAFLGHTRFANYFTIVIFPIQAHYLPCRKTRHRVSDEGVSLMRRLPQSVTCWLGYGRAHLDTAPD